MRFTNSFKYAHKTDKVAGSFGTRVYTTTRTDFPRTIISNTQDCTTIYKNPMTPCLSYNYFYSTDGVSDQEREFMKTTCKAGLMTGEVRAPFEWIERATFKNIKGGFMVSAEDVKCLHYNITGLTHETFNMSLTKGKLGYSINCLNSC